jgi:heterotetrameric sarcosine oxidase gamma subunit
MTYDVQIDRLPIYALFDLKGPQKELRTWTKGALKFPDAPNTLSRRGSVVLCHLGPKRWLLRDDLRNETSHSETLKPDEATTNISIVRVSDTQTFFSITGPDALEVMSIGCTLDLHPSVFGPDTVSYTEFFGIKALVLRCDGGFECAVEQSYGNMIEDFLTRAIA